MERIVTERPDGSRRVAMSTVGPSLTEQSHKGAVDINNIVAKYVRTGFMESRFETPMYGDFSGFDDFHSLKQKLNRAQEDFMHLPAVLRKRFDNDPAKLIEFVQDPENEGEAIELGLLPKEAPEEPAEPVSEPEPEPEPS